MPRASFYARHPYKARPPKLGACPVCGTMFTATRRRRFCSTRCRMKAHREQQRKG